jgi:hypothetical protein
LTTGNTRKGASNTPQEEGTTLGTGIFQGANHLVIVATAEDDPAGLVRARLRRSGYPVLLGIQCEMCEGALVLVGTVPTFHLKQIAQELAAHTRGVWKVENRLLVTSSAGPNMARSINDAGSVP